MPVGYNTQFLICKGYSKSLWLNHEGERYRGHSMHENTASQYKNINLEQKFSDHIFTLLACPPWISLTRKPLQKQEEWQIFEMKYLNTSTLFCPNYPLKWVWKNRRKWAFLIYIFPWKTDLNTCIWHHILTSVTEWYLRKKEEAFFICLFWEIGPSIYWSQNSPEMMYYAFSQL